MKTTIILLAAICCVVSSTFSYAENSTRLTVTPQDLEIGAFYNGTAVTATATLTLALPKRGPGQQQIGDVDAGDEQHEPDRGEQDEQ